MPTYEWQQRFGADLSKLGPVQRAAFQASVRQFIEDLDRGAFRKSLRVKGVHSAPGVFEMSWAPDGRATFQFGQSPLTGGAHIVWRRIGTHEVFRSP